MANNILSNLFNNNSNNRSQNSYQPNTGVVSKAIDKAFSPNPFRRNQKSPDKWPNDDKHNQAKSYLSYANKYANSGDFDDAKYNAEQAARLTSDAKTSAWYECLAYIDTQQHNYVEALNMYAGMLTELSDRNEQINCLYNMVNCAYKSNNRPAGEECLQKLCELTPNDARPYRLMGEHANDAAQAHQYFQKAVSISGLGIDYWYLGKTEMNDVNQRIKDIQIACQKGDYTSWWLSLGNIYYQMTKGLDDSAKILQYRQKAVLAYVRGISGIAKPHSKKDKDKSKAKGICAYHLHLFLMAHTLMSKIKDPQAIRYLAGLPLRSDIGPLDEYLTEPEYNRSPLVTSVQGLEAGLYKISGDSSESMTKTYGLLSALCRRGGWYDQSVRCKHIAELLGNGSNSSEYAKDIRNMDSKHYKDYTRRLSQLVGLSNVKQKINEFADVAMVQKIRSHKRGHEEMHLVFEGAPGTGKTTVANLMAGILYQKHIIQKPKLVAVNGSQITGQYYGQATANIRRLIQKAMGGVLFIDEAYHLAHRNSHNGNSDFQDEAMNEFVPDIERYKNNLVVILAGYTDLMENFLNHSNPGLSSRFPRSERILFPNYSNVECIEILGLYLKENGYVVNSDRTSDILSQYITNLVSHAKPSTFGNARTIRNFYDVLYSVQNVRIANQYSVEQITEMSKQNNPALNMITAHDALVAVKRCTKR